jgi:hypothetical protein
MCRNLGFDFLRPNRLDKFSMIQFESYTVPHYRILFGPSGVCALPLGVPGRTKCLILMLLFSPLFLSEILLVFLSNTNIRISTPKNVRTHPPPGTMLFLGG